MKWKSTQPKIMGIDMEYFSNFPKIKYDGNVIRNIGLRVKIIEGLRSDPYAFLPYTVKEGERPEDIAYYYYGSVDYVWIVFLSNNILDPYFEWPLSENEFFHSLAKKYKDAAKEDLGVDYLSDIDVFHWTMNEMRTANILYYEKDGVHISPDTYRLGLVELTGWSPIRIFDAELRNNENMRNIQLLSNTYLNVAEKNIRDLLRDG